jgi:uncharacterized ferredoxin-like protein
MKKQLILMLLFSVGFSWAGEPTMKDVLAELKGLKSFRRDTIVTSVVMGKDLEKLTRWHEQLVDIQKNIDTLKELDQNSVLEGEHKVMFLGLRNFSKK